MHVTIKKKNKSNKSNQQPFIKTAAIMTYSSLYSTLTFLS